MQKTASMQKSKEVVLLMMKSICREQVLTAMRKGLYQDVHHEHGSKSI